MNTGSLILGNQVWFAREGDAHTIPSAGTTGRAVKPGATDTSWIDLGIVSDLSIDPQREEREVFAPTPGQIRLYDVIETKRGLTVKFTCEELSKLSFETLMGSLKITADAFQYNPLEGVTKKGWLKVQQYNQADALQHTVDLFVHLKCSEQSFGDAIVQAKFECKVLHSTLNTGTLA